MKYKEGYSAWIATALWSIRKWLSIKPISGLASMHTRGYNSMNDSKKLLAKKGKNKSHKQYHW